jgi:CSLREA domain-containing protein
VALLGPGGQAGASGFDVNSFADTPDANPGDGACADAGGACTLRAAVMEANAQPGGDTIKLPLGTFTLQTAGTDNAAALGDLDVNGSLVIQGSGGHGTVIDGYGAVTRDRVFHVLEGANLQLSDLEVRGGDTSILHGAGGAFLNQGTLTVRFATIAGSRGDAAGAIHNLGTLTLEQVLVAGNTAAGANHGGGIYNAGAMTLTNVTLSGNQAGGVGGGLTSAMGSESTLVNVTIANNHAANGGGIYGTGAINMQNSIVAGNSDDEGRPDCAANVMSGGHNIVQEPVGCGGLGDADLAGVDPLLGPLTDNGGISDTHALLAGSPAIDAGDDDACPDRDQRNFARPQGAGCDIGAFELAGEPGPAPTPTSTPPAILPGDANGDGVIDARDAALILQFDAGLLVFIRYPEEWDVNGDGAVDSRDAALVLQYVAGLIDRWPP